VVDTLQAARRHERSATESGRDPYLINDWPESRWRNWLALGSGRFDPGSLGFENLGQGLRRRFAKSRTVGNIGDVADVSAVFLAEENVHVVVFYSSPPKDRLHRSARSSN